MRCLLVVAVSLFGLSVLAQPGGFGPQVPANGGPMPSYFSGTNCRASGYAQLGEPILFAYLHLNGELVAYYEYQPNDPEPLHAITLEVMFDSSHWMDGTEVEVKFGVYGAATGWQVATGTSVVRNKAMLWEHPDPNITSDPVLIVESLLRDKNYTLNVQNGGSWSRDAYLSMMGGCNVMFYAGHGNPSSHSAGDGVPISWIHYEEKRIEQIGGGVPPFNSGDPPVNLLYLLACCCGVTNNFIRACYPYYMAWGGPWMENQALFAWRVTIYLDEYAGLTTTVWSPMAAGRTALDAQLTFEQAILNGEAVYTKMDPATGNRVPMEVGDLALYSGRDEYGCVRIKSVYTGTNVQPVGWYRVTIPF